MELDAWFQQQNICNMFFGKTDYNTVYQQKLLIPDQTQFHLLVWQELLEISDFFQMLVPCQVPHHPDWPKIEAIGEKIDYNNIQTQIASNYYS